MGFLGGAFQSPMMKRTSLGGPLMSKIMFLLSCLRKIYNP